MHLSNLSEKVKVIVFLLAYELFEGMTRKGSRLLKLSAKHDYNETGKWNQRVTFFHGN